MRWAPINLDRRPNLLDGKPIVLPQPSLVIRYRCLICFALAALVIAAGTALSRRRLFVSRAH